MDDHDGALSTLKDRDWALIEDIPPETRRVGAMFAGAAKCVATSTPRPKCSWDAKRWADSAQVVEGAKLGARGAAHQKALAALGAAFPRREAFKGSPELWVRSVLRWASRSEDSLDALVSLTKLRTTLLARYSGDTSGALEQIDKFVEAALRGVSAQELLERVIAREEVLERCSFAGQDELWPYDDQVRLCESLCASLRREGADLWLYRTPPSGGKTASVALLGAVLAQQPGKKPFVLFTCPFQHVRLEAARSLCAACVPFAIVSSCVASPSFRCYYQGKRREKKTPAPASLAQRVEWSVRECERCDLVPIVLVCDVVSARVFAAERPDDILIVDEALAGVGSEDPAMVKVARAARDIFGSSTRRLVLISATLFDCDFDDVIRSLRERFGRADLHLVEADRLSLNFTAMDASGRLWAPHRVLPASDWPRLAEVMRTPRHAHLLRFYAPRALLGLLLDTQRGADVASAELLTHEGLRAVALRLLERGVGEATPEVAVFSCPGRGELCRRHAHLWPGTTIIVCDREGYAREELAPLLADVEPLRRLLKRTKSAKSAQPHIPRKKAHDEERYVAVEDDDASQCPTWPTWCIINSAEHSKRFGAPLVPKHGRRGPFLIPQDIVDHSNVDVLEALSSGAVLFGDRRCDMAFGAFAMSAVDCSRVSHVVSDEAIMYGTNLSCERLYYDAASRRPTDDELRQLCGRVGRSGKCTTAQLILPLEHMLRLLSLDTREVNVVPA